MRFSSVCDPGVLIHDTCDLIFSTHQSTESGNQLLSQKRVHACSIDERISTEVEEGDHSERVIQRHITGYTQAAELEDDSELERQIAENEERNDDHHGLDDVFLRLARRL